MPKQRTVLIEPALGPVVWLGGVGVVFKVFAEQTSGAVSVVEHPVLPGALVPPHIHHGEDELSYVIAGTIGARVGDEVVEATQGAYLLKPRGMPHTFWNATDQPARVLEFIWPGGFERFFDELAVEFAAGAGVPDQDAVASLAQRYGQTFVMDWVPELEHRYGVSVLHSGGTDYRSETNR
jgi:quercetin dioxygenase-like cupin family protein